MQDNPNADNMILFPYTGGQERTQTSESVGYEPPSAGLPGVNGRADTGCKLPYDGYTGTQNISKIFPEVRGTYKGQ